MPLRTRCPARRNLEPGRCCSLGSARRKSCPSENPPRSIYDPGSLIAGSLIEGIVLRNCPAFVFLFFGHREKLLVSRLLAGTAVAPAFVVQDDQRRRIFPFHQIPGNQRVLSFGSA